MNQQLNNLLWIEELLPDHIVSKNMHGGVGYYLEDKLILILVESSLTYEHKGITYPFQIWNGCLFPIEKMKQTKVWVSFQYLENHPASDKWLYLPADTEEFEDKVKEVLRAIKKGNPLFGIPIKITKPTESIEAEELDLSKPSLFSDRPVVFSKKKIAKDTSKPVKKVKANKKSGNDLLLAVLKRHRK